MLGTKDAGMLLVTPDTVVVRRRYQMVLDPPGEMMPGTRREGLLCFEAYGMSGKIIH